MKGVVVHPDNILIKTNTEWNCWQTADVPCTCTLLRALASAAEAVETTNAKVYEVSIAGECFPWETYFQYNDGSNQYIVEEVRVL